MHSQPPSDHDLLRRFQSGEEAALRQFYRRHEAGLFVSLHAVLKSEEAAAEVLHQVFIDLCQSLDQYLAAERVAPYLYRAAINEARKALRSGERRRAAAERAWRLRARPDEVGDPAETVAERETAAALTAALNELDQESRQIVLLHLYEGFSFAEIQELTGLAERTMYRRYREALEFLKKKLH